MKTVRISMDKTFPINEFKNVKNILNDAVSKKSDPKIKTIRNDKEFRVIHVSGIDDHDVQEVIDEMFKYGYPARLI